MGTTAIAACTAELEAAQSATKASAATAGADNQFHCCFAQNK